MSDLTRFLFNTKSCTLNETGLTSLYRPMLIKLSLSLFRFLAERAAFAAEVHNV